MIRLRRTPLQNAPAGLAPTGRPLPTPGPAWGILQPLMGALIGRLGRQGPAPADVQRAFHRGARFVVAAKTLRGWRTEWEG